MATCGTITVESAFDAGAVTVANCSLGATSVSPGQPVDVTVTVQNNNGVPASALVRVFIGGNQMRETGVQLDSNGSRTASVTVIAPNVTGDHSVTVELAGIASATGAAPRTTSGFTLQQPTAAAPPLEAMADGGTVEKDKDTDDCGCGCGGSCGGDGLLSFDVAGAFASF